MKNCPYCNKPMIEYEYYDSLNKEYECINCHRIFKEHLSFIGKILRKFKLI